MSESVIEAPVAGSVVRIVAATGDTLQPGETVVVLESMKMEFEVEMPERGTIIGLLAAEQDMVEEGQTLATYRA